MEPDKYFWLHDGRALKSLKELSDSLENMPGDVFSHHVTKERNDFSNWIKDVIGDKDLAQRVYSLKTTKEMNQQIRIKLALNYSALNLNKNWDKPTEKKISELFQSLEKKNAPVKAEIKKEPEKAAASKNPEPKKIEPKKEQNRFGQQYAKKPEQQKIQEPKKIESQKIENKQVKIQISKPAKEANFDSILKELLTSSKAENISSKAEKAPEQKAAEQVKQAKSAARPEAHAQCAKIVPQFSSQHIRVGAGCGCKSYKCGVLEILVGLIVGVLLGLVWAGAI
jgi:HD superfamily phosphohydrolase